MIRDLMKCCLCLVLILTARLPAAADLDNGAAVYGLWCEHCHAAGPGHPGTQQLAISHGADLAVIRGRDELSPQYIAVVVRKGLGMMPPLRKTEVSDQQLNDLISYLLSSE